MVNLLLRMGFIGSMFRFTGKTAVLGAKVGLFVGSVQLTSELGVWVARKILMFQL